MCGKNRPPNHWKLGSRYTLSWGWSSWASCWKMKSTVPGLKLDRIEVMRLKWLGVRDVPVWNCFHIELFERLSLQFNYLQLRDQCQCTHQLLNSLWMSLVGCLRFLGSGVARDLAVLFGILTARTTINTWYGISMYILETSCAMLC